MGENLAGKQACHKNASCFFKSIFMFAFMLLFLLPLFFIDPHRSTISTKWGGLSLLFSTSCIDPSHGHYSEHVPCPVGNGNIAKMMDGKIKGDEKQFHREWLRCRVEVPELQGIVQEVNFN